MGVTSAECEDLPGREVEILRQGRGFLLRSGDGAVDLRCRLIQAGRADRGADARISTELTEAYTRGDDGSREYTFTVAHVNDALTIKCHDSR